MNAHLYPLLSVHSLLISPFTHLALIMMVYFYFHGHLKLTVHSNNTFFTLYAAISGLSLTSAIEGCSPLHIKHACVDRVRSFHSVFECKF